MDDSLQLHPQLSVREMPAVPEVQPQLREVYNLDNQDRIRFVARTTLS